MSCHQGTGNVEIQQEDIKILLMGNPNVGKSVVFSKLTGVHVESSNYAGTTVDYTIGNIQLQKHTGVMIDVPGTYSLTATSEAEEVAVRLLNEGADVIICVLDATNLERNLDLALQLKQYNIPVVYSLNLVDVAERQGIEIDEKKLESELDAPVIPTIAIKNTGLKKLLDTAYEMIGSPVIKTIKLSQHDRWSLAETITKKVERKSFKQPTFLEKLGDWTVKPFPGWIIAFFVLILSLGVVVGGGKALRSVILLPVINGWIVPFVTEIVSKVTHPGIIRNLLVGEFGILVKGIEWPFALILPYVLLFYIVFSFLEDSGYLPRIGVLADGLLRKLGIQGGNIIPILMGYGCAVPAILGTRAATTKKERLMVASLVSLAIPCASQSGAFFALLSDTSILVLIGVYMISFLTIIGVGVIMDRIIPGETQPMLLEIPNLLMPDSKAFAKKLIIRMRHFLVDAEGPMIIGIIFASVVAETGVLQVASEWIKPIVEVWLGLPAEASLSLMLGIIRRELAVLPLLELNLNTLQLLVGSVVALFYLPCLSVFAVLAKEFSFKIAIIIGIVTTVSAFLFAGIINQIGQLLMLVF